MSKDNRPISEAQLDYIASLTAGDDPLLRELKEAAVAAGIPSIWISEVQGSCIQILLKLLGAESVIEIGTLAGYSAIWMARAMAPSGKVTTVEVNPKHASFAREWIARSDVASQVEVILGSGDDVLPTLEEGSFDAAFIDADKGGYEGYLEESLRLVRSGGLIMADNALAFGSLLDDSCQEKSVQALRQFNRKIAGVESLHSLLVPLGDGFWIGYKA